MKSFAELEKSLHIYDPNIHAYIKNYQLIQNNKVIFISAKKAFYFDRSDFENVSTVVYLRKFNDIKDLNSLLETTYNISDENIIICGKFKNTPQTNFVLHTYSKIFSALNELTGDKPYKVLSLKRVLAYLNAYNFKLLNVEEIDGMTYFHAIKK